MQTTLLIWNWINIFYRFIYYFFFGKADQIHKEKERNRERSSISCFTPLVATPGESGRKVEQKTVQPQRRIT